MNLISKSYSKTTILVVSEILERFPTKSLKIDHYGKGDRIELGTINHIALGVRSGAVELYFESDPYDGGEHNHHNPAEIFTELEPLMDRIKSLVP